jgi:hypothetical protein
MNVKWIQISTFKISFLSILGTFANIRKEKINFSVSVRPSVRLHGTTQPLLDGFHKIWNLGTFRIYVVKIQASFKLDKHNGYFTWRPMYIFYYISLFLSLSSVPRIINVYYKSCRANQNAHFIFGNTFFENHTVPGIRWRNIVKLDRPQTTIWRMRISCWIPGAKNTHPVYVTLVAFLLQQQLHECASCYVVRTLPYLFTSTVTIKGHESLFPSCKNIYTDCDLCNTKLI